MIGISVAEAGVNTRVRAEEVIPGSRRLFTTFGELLVHLMVSKLMCMKVRIVSFFTLSLTISAVHLCGKRRHAYTRFGGAASSPSLRSACRIMVSTRVLNSFNDAILSRIKRKYTHDDTVDNTAPDTVYQYLCIAREIRGSGGKRIPGFMTDGFLASSRCRPTVGGAVLYRPQCSPHLCVNVCCQRRACLSKRQTNARRRTCAPSRKHHQ